MRDILPEAVLESLREHYYAAVGVFQLELLDGFGHVVRRKALMFQAKKNWTGANKQLLEQAEQMVAYTPSAIVVDYRNTGFSGVATVDVIETGGIGDASNQIARSDSQRFSVTSSFGADAAR